MTITELEKESTLEELRARLDRIDAQLVELIAERQATIAGISSVKRSTGSPLRDFKRESQVFERVQQRAAELGVEPRVAREVMRHLIRYSLTVQEKTRVTAGRPGSGQTALIIGGAGKIGGWFAQFLDGQGFSIEIADPAAAPGPGILKDWRTSDLRHDYIVVASPLGATNEILRELAERRPNGVIFDVGSLKSPLRSGIQALRDKGLRVTSVHPMFGPDTDLLSGRHVIFIDLGAGDACERARQLFSSTMAEQVVMGLDEHDRLIAFVLGLSHAVNLVFLSALRDSGESALRLLELSSTTFDAQFDIARNVARESPYLYYEIQRLNAYGMNALTALSNAVAALKDNVEHGDEAEFVARMRSLNEYAESRRAGQKP